MLTALSAIAAEQAAHPVETLQKTKQFFNFVWWCITNLPSKQHGADNS